MGDKDDLKVDVAELKSQVANLTSLVETILSQSTNSKLHELAAQTTSAEPTTELPSAEKLNQIQTEKAYKDQADEARTAAAIQAYTRHVYGSADYRHPSQVEPETREAALEWDRNGRPHLQRKIAFQSSTDQPLYAGT